VPTLLVLPASTFTPADRLRAIANDDAGVLEPRRKFLSKFLGLDWREQASEVSAQRTAALETIWKTIIRRDIREMHAAGMDVLVGTDTAVLNVYPGFSVHDEMALFATELGMSPIEVLESATRRSAQFLRLGDSVGTVERGKIADLLLLDGDPLQDIRNTSLIAAVLTRGRVFERDGLENLKTAVLSAEDVKVDDWGRTRKR
jgi:imidazolonepropionase-like amidohydrolase